MEISEKRVVVYFIRTKIGTRNLNDEVFLFVKLYDFTIAFKSIISFDSLPFSFLNHTFSIPTATFLFTFYNFVHIPMSNILV